jgi:TP901 family phage tail tape measure protein
MQSLGSSMSSVGGALMTLTAPLVAIGAVGLRVAANFDQTMKMIEVFGNVAPDELKKVEQAALDMGKATKFTAEDAAEAMLDLLKSGENLEQTLSTMPAVLNLAGAGNINLAQSAGIVTTALAAFQMKVEDSGRVADALAQAANASRAEVSDLGMALVSVGPSAAQMGLSIEDTAAALAIMANNGIMGAEAGTQLRTLLSQLARPTADNEKAFTKLGVSLYDASGRMRPLGTLLAEMKTKLSALPMQSQIELTQALAGAYGSTALRALLASEGLDSMLAAMEAAPGAATVAGAFMDTFAGKTESLRGSIETLMISALTPFMNNVLGPLVDKLIPVVNAIADWAAANPELVTTVVSLVAAVAGLGTGMWAAGHAISAIGTLLGALTSPIGLAVAAIGGLVLAFQTNFLGIRDALQPVVDWLGGVWTRLSTFFETLRFFDGDFWWALQQALPELGPQIRDLQEALEPVGTALSNIVNGIKDLIEDHPQVIEAAAVIGIGFAAWSVAAWAATAATSALTAAVGLLFSPFVLAALAVGGVVVALEAAGPVIDRLILPAARCTAAGLVDFGTCRKPVGRRTHEM